MLEDTGSALGADNQIVVYGESVEAYSCVAALLELGLSASFITLVEAFPPEEPALRVNCFNNETVDERVQDSLARLGVRVLRGCRYGGWRLHGSRADAVRLLAPLHALQLPCFALFYYGTRDIDIHSFKAITESGLVYDGGLVVGRAFETNDPHVWAAGPATRYSRRLHAAPRLQRYYSSEDVGEALAAMFLHKLDPFMSQVPEPDSPSNEFLPRQSSSLFGIKGSYGSIASSRISLTASKSRWQPVSKYSSAVFQCATLPGPLYYLRVRAPGRDTPEAVQKLLPNQGHSLVTDKRGNFCSVRLNALHCISAVTCLSKKPFCPEIFIHLYGKHEAYFNKLLARFKLNLIDDLYDYFMKPFMSALYQETFTDLLIDLHEQEVATVHDVVRTKFLEFHGELPATVKHDDTTPCLLSSQCLATKDTPTKKKAKNIPSECGQEEALRHEASVFWRAVGGENIVLQRLARYLVRNSVTNPHYAVPDVQLLK